MLLHSNIEQVACSHCYYPTRHFHGYYLQRNFSRVFYCVKT